MLCCREINKEARRKFCIRKHKGQKIMSAENGFTIITVTNCVYEDHFQNPGTRRGSPMDNGFEF